VVVVESASGDRVAKEDAMMLAVPILILVAFFLARLFVRLTVHALPLFAGVSAALVIHNAGGGLIVALMSGALAGIGVAATGRTCFDRTSAPMGRLGICLAFAVPASVAAYHAASGLSSGMDLPRSWSFVIPIVSALLVGHAAWRDIVSDRARYRQ
jgi:hypothetical protein